MLRPGVIGLRGAELEVSDPEASARFYTAAWALEEVGREAGVIRLRAADRAHHVLALRACTGAPRLREIVLAAAGREALTAIHARAAAAGARVLEPPGPRPAAAGGGHGFALASPDGVALRITCDVRDHADRIGDRSRPLNLTHVVINSQDVPRERGFFEDILGFRLSDSTRTMEFMRSGTHHHSLAIAGGAPATLNHLAFEMSDFDGLMRGCGRLKAAGATLEWGVGRHGPGNNIFAYFLDPDGFAIEYTTGMEHVDEAEHVPGTAQYWSDFPMRPCRWGMATRPSEALMRAMSGEVAR